MERPWEHQNHILFRGRRVAAEIGKVLVNWLLAKLEQDREIREIDTGPEILQC